MRYESQITLSQMLFDGFATQSEVQRQLSRLNSAAYRVQQAAEFVGLDAVEAHLDVLRNQVLVELARENLAEHRRLGGKVRQLEDQGASSIADVRQSEARIAAAETALATAQGNLRDAQARYHERGRHGGGESCRIRRCRSRPCPRARPPRPPRRRSTIRTSRSRTPTSMRPRPSSRARARATIRGSTSRPARPRTRIWTASGAATSTRRPCSCSATICSAAAPTSPASARRSRALSEARQNLRQAQRDAEREARVAYNALVTARARVEALRAAVEAQRATRDVYAQQFDLGQRSLLDLLDAENELFVARSNLTTAQYTEMFGVYRVLAVTGDLLTTLNIDRPKQSIDIYRERKEPIHETVPASTNDHG